MSYANMDGVPTQTAGTSELLASDWNTYVRDNFDSIKFGHIVVANDAAKSAIGTPAEGTMVYQTDNDTLWVYNGGWVRAVNTASLQDAAVSSAKLDASVGARVAQGHVVVADNAAKTALGNVAEGYMVYQSDVDKLFVNSNGSTANWVEVGGVKTPSGATTQSINVRPPFTTASRTATTLPSGVGTLLNFDVGSSNDGMFTATSTNITIKTPGVYFVSAYADFGAQSGGVRSLIPKLNGSAFTGTSRTSTGGVINDLLNVSTAYAFALNDVLTFEVVQNSGVGIGIAGSAQVVYLGASA